MTEYMSEYILYDMLKRLSENVLDITKQIATLTPMVFDNEKKINKLSDEISILKETIKQLNNVSS